VIANRTVSRAQAIKDLFAAHGHVDAVGFDALAAETPFDIVINCTSAGLKGDLPPLPVNIIGAGTWCYDMIYGAGETDFQNWARQLGAEKAMDGCGMLVEQAAEAFWLWRGVRPDTGPVLAALRQILGKAA
jgi:shikimate dehydrogenase